MVLAIKALNAASTAIHTYNFVAVCPDFSPLEISMVFSVVREHLDSCEMAYLCRQDTTHKSTCGKQRSRVSSS